MSCVRNSLSIVKRILFQKMFWWGLCWGRGEFRDSVIAGSSRNPGAAGLQEPPSQRQPLRALGASASLREPPFQRRLLRVPQGSLRFIQGFLCLLFENLSASAWLLMASGAGASPSSSWVPAPSSTSPLRFTALLPRLPAPALWGPRFQRLQGFLVSTDTFPRAC